MIDPNGTFVAVGSAAVQYKSSWRGLGHLAGTRLVSFGRRRTTRCFITKVRRADREALAQFIDSGLRSPSSAGVTHLARPASPSSSSAKVTRTERSSSRSVDTASTSSVAACAVAPAAPGAACGRRRDPQRRPIAPKARGTMCYARVSDAAVLRGLPKAEGLPSPRWRSTNFTTGGGQWR